MKRTTEAKRPPFELRLSNNVQSLEGFKAQLALPEAQNWTFSKKKVVILDLDNTDLKFSVLNTSPLLKPVLESFKNDGIAVCLVTNKTILNENGKDINPAAKATLEELHRNYPDTIDLVLFDPKHSDFDLFSSKDANKKAMLDSCVSAYSEDTAFCYVGLDETILDYAATQHGIPALNIYYTREGSLRIPRNNAINVEIQKCGVLGVALTEATYALSDYDPTEGYKGQQRPQARNASSTLSANSSRSYTGVPRDPRYQPGKYSSGKDLSREFSHLPGKPTGYTRLADDHPIDLDAGVASRSPKDWFFHHFIKSPSFSEAPSTAGKTFREAMGIVKQYLYANLVLAPFKALFLIFPFDGYDPVTNRISYASGAKVPEPYVIQSFKDVSIKLLLTALIGFPSRAIKDPKTGKPTISIVQILKNFVGNIDWEKDTPRDKKRLQIVGIPLKGLVFLPIKIVLIPFKAILNGLKLLTEFLPWLATSLSYFVYQIPVLGSSKTWQWKNDLSQNGFNPIALGLMLLSAVLGLVSIPLFFFHVFCRTVMVTGRTITSPLISLRKAFAVGSELKVPGISDTSQRRLAIVLGVLCAGVSVFITTISWMILWPLFVNYAIANMPTLMSIVNGILGSQPVTASLTALQGATTAVGAFLHTVFTGFVTGLSNFMGVQITYTAIVAVTALPFALAFSALADYLSDRWANWHDGEIFKARPVVVAPAPDNSSNNSSHLPSNPSPPGGAPQSTNARPAAVQNTSFGIAPKPQADASAPGTTSKTAKPPTTSLAHGYSLLEEAKVGLNEVTADVKRDEQRLVGQGKLSFGQASQAANQADRQQRQTRRALRGDDSPSPTTAKAKPPAATSPQRTPIAKAPTKKRA